MQVTSRVTGKKYLTEKAIFIRNFSQFSAYMNNGAEKNLLDIYYDSSQGRNPMVFVFEKNDDLKKLYKLWNEKKLIY